MATGSPATLPAVAAWRHGSGSALGRH